MAPFNTSASDMTPGPGVGNENSPSPNLPAAALLLGAAPAAPNIPAPEPDLSGLTQLGGDNVAPPVAASNTGVSPSPQQQLAQQIGAKAHNLMATSKDPNAPMGWAKAWMASVMGSLGDAGSIGSTPENLTSGLGGAMYGISKVMGARNERLQKQKEFDAQQKQQDVMNKREDQKLKDQEEEQGYMIAQHKISIGLQQRAMTEADSKYIYDKIYGPWKKGEEAQGATVIKEDMSQNELNQLALAHANSVTDPKGIKWLKDQDVRQDGVRLLRGPDNKPVPEIGSDGKPTGEFKTEPTFGAYTYGDPHTMDETFAKELNDNDIGTHYAKGDLVPARDYAYLKVKLGDMLADKLNFDKIALAANQTKQQIDDLHKKQEYPAATDALSHWTAAAGNPIEGYEDLQKAAEAPDGTPVENLTRAKAQEQLKAVQDVYGPEILKGAIDEHFKGQIEQIKANAVKAKNAPLDIEGNPDLAGDEYIKSLPAGRQGIVKGITNGSIQMGGAGGLQRMLSNKDGQQLLAEAKHADPDLDTGKVAAYSEAYKKFTTDKNIAGQLNAARTGFRHFKALYEDNKNPLSYVAGEGYAQREADLNDASKELARFLAGGQSPTKEDIETARASLDPSVARDPLHPVNLKQAAVKRQNDRIREKVEEYASQWDEALPSKKWVKPMPGWDKAAEDAMNYVHYDGNVPDDVPGLQGSPAAGQAGTRSPAPALTLTLPNGRVATFQTQKQMDDAKAALAKAMAKVQ